MRFVLTLLLLLTSACLTTRIEVDTTVYPHPIPNLRLVDLVTKCARGATLEPLRSELKGDPSLDGVKQSARAPLNWLEGEED
ncbi:MAG: hypothetical protein MK213_00255 [Planctomycetes bacterium]|nr:hypothetical protein [Planctomycetota bacterium]